jgi:FKBP-type peptidyl-prolyl cis-trans isomerase FkpA
MNIRPLTLAVLAASLLAACTSSENKPTPAASPAAPVAATSATMKTRTTASGLAIEDITIGSGKEAKTGDQVTVNYVGKLLTGDTFDSSYSRNEPFHFTLGLGQVIKGWDEGVAGMRVGGKRQLTIPPALGYGERGAGRVIPPNAVLVFTVELVGVE